MNALTLLKQDHQNVEALFERFEKKLEQHSGRLARAAVELAKDWRSDRILRRLDALLIVMDAEQGFAAYVIESDPGSGDR